MGMVADGNSPSGALWHAIRREAETVLANDPIFGRSLSASILEHADLGAAVSYQIGQRLGKDAGDRRQFARLAGEAFAASDLVEAAGRDLAGIVRHDPTSTALLPPLVNFKGYVALQAWRVSNWLWHQNRHDLALLLQSLSSDSLQVSIHPSASIGTAVFLDHATGIVVGPFATIGDEVTIMQNVTIGRQVETPNRAPKVGRGVLLSTGGNDYRRHQYRRLCQDQRGVGCDARRADRLHGGRCPRAPDPLPRTGSSLSLDHRRRTSRQRVLRTVLPLDGEGRNPLR